MNLKPSKKYKIKKIDAIIVVALIVIAGLVLFKAGYIGEDPDPTPDPDPDPVPTPPPILTPPTSFIPGYMMGVSGEDEGVHFDKIRICREWWYYSVIFDDESELAGWTISISFNHMARSDLLGQLKPDLLVFTLHSPDGEEYGGMINKKRGLGILSQPTLEAKSPGVSLKFEDSWAEGRAPEWHVHVEDNDIDNDHVIVADLRFFAPSEPIWTMGERAFQKSKSNLASYMFTGCNVTGTVQIDNSEYDVIGKGHHEHSWSPNIITRGSINGWDWFHMTLDNGWNIYLTNYYPTPQLITSLTSKTNPISSLIITTDDGRTMTMLNNIDLKITKSDEKIFPFVKMPSEFNLEAKPSILQPLILPYNMQLNLNINAENTYEQVWKFPTYVGMKVGMSSISGKIKWSDDDGEYEIELNGLASSWSMRALL